jgi:hypothetical protein
MMQPLHRIAELLQTDSALGRLNARRHELDALLARVRRLLPPTLAPHCVATVAKAERLVLFADSPAWSSRLRFFSSELATALCGQGLFRAPPRVEIRVHLPATLPGRDAAGTPPRAPLQLSAGTASLLAQTAASLEDPELAAALRRLSRHRRETTASG